MTIIPVQHSRYRLDRSSKYFNIAQICDMWEAQNYCALRISTQDCDKRHQLEWALCRKRLDRDVSLVKKCKLGEEFPEYLGQSNKTLREFSLAQINNFYSQQKIEVFLRIYDTEESWRVAHICCNLPEYPIETSNCLLYTSPSPRDS